MAELAKMLNTAGRPAGASRVDQIAGADRSGYSTKQPSWGRVAIMRRLGGVAALLCVLNAVGTIAPYRLLPTSLPTARLRPARWGDDERARLRTADDWSGLNPTFVVKPDAIRLGVNTTSPEDFRDIQYAKLARPPDAEYAGSTCLSHSPDSVCPIPGQCAPPGDEAAQRLVQENGPCLHWRSGRLAHPVSLTPHDVQRARLVQPFTARWEADGTWDGRAWFPRPATSRPKYRSFTPQDMHRCLAGKRVLFQGDSMVRQIKNRLVHWSREIPVRRRACSPS